MIWKSVTFSYFNFCPLFRVGVGLFFIFIKMFFAQLKYFFGKKIFFNRSVSIVSLSNEKIHQREIGPSISPFSTSTLFVCAVDALMDRTDGPPFSNHHKGNMGRDALHSGVPTDLVRHKRVIYFCVPKECLLCLLYT